jgi:ribosome maturation factor RimP
MTQETSNPSSTRHPHENLIQVVSQWIHPLGYQVVHIEVQTHRQKILRIFIDHLEFSSEKAIGIEDCVRVSRAIEESLDQSQDVDKTFDGSYELEVSSPGVERPLRTLQDFERFSNREIRVNVYRALTHEEIENTLYHAKNPKQKNFLGQLLGLRGDKIVLKITEKSGDLGLKRAKSKQKALPNTNSVEGSEILIPLPLISKAHLEPQFDFERSDESEKIQ